MKQIYQERGQWSQWQNPVCAGSYRLACCDCGLTHNFQFRVMAAGKEVDLRKVRVEFRVCRNERSTAAVRQRGYPCRCIPSKYAHSKKT